MHFTAFLTICNLEADNAGMGGAAAGVSPADSDAGLSGESEKELSENN